MPDPEVGQAGWMMDVGDPQATMDEMHDSPAMQRVHAQMPEGLRAQCDATHEQMSQTMGAMPGGMGGMGWDWRAHAGHHAGSPPSR
jgi:hypothetical protein